MTNDEFYALVRKIPTYAFIPDFHHVRFSIRGSHAVRAHQVRTAELTRTADSSTVIRHTIHRDSRETIVTDYYWNELGQRVRVTETCAI